MAFGIPIFEHYLKTCDDREIKYENVEINQKPPVALIISPTRELAHQISSHLTDLCSTALFTSPSIATLTGGLSLHKQQRLLTKADIIVGTPGRLWEAVSENHIFATWLKNIKFLVVDEADRLLSEGHFKEVEDILNALDRADDIQDDDNSKGNRSIGGISQRQTLVFSATFQRDLQQKLAGRGKPLSSNLMDKLEAMDYLLKKLNFREEKPKFIDVNPMSQMSSNLKEGILQCGALEKVCAIVLLYISMSKLLSTGSLSLCYVTSLPENSHTNIHKFDYVSSSAYPFPPESQHNSRRLAFANAPKSPTSLH